MRPAKQARLNRPLARLDVQIRDKAGKRLVNSIFMVLLFDHAMCTRLQAGRGHANCDCVRMREYRTNRCSPHRWQGTMAPRFDLCSGSQSWIWLQGLASNAEDFLQSGTV